MLLASPALNIDATNAMGETPLMMAALKGRLDWAKKLMERGAKVQKPGWSPVHYAATGPSTELLAMLLDRGADINALAPNRNTPLMMAARYGPRGKRQAAGAAWRQQEADQRPQSVGRRHGAHCERAWLLPLLQ